MAGKKPDVTSPTVEGHRPGASPPDGGPVDPSGATVSWRQGDPGGSEGGVPTPAEAAASGGLLRRVAQFVLLERLGGGGMGVVFAAFDEKLERKVAIKLVATQGGDGRAQERLLREAQAQARLSHPNVVTVYEVGALPEGQLFIAMELVKGETLREWQRSEKRSWQDILTRYAAAGEGLAAAHSSSIVHRDFKPDNILVGEDGRVRVADFGLAFAAEPGTPASRPPSISDASASGRLETSSGSPSASPGRPGRPGTAPVATAGRSARSPMLTAAGTVAGTPGYMAPEQLSGAAVDARTDQFSFCVALYEALYDERPYADFAFLHEERPAMRRSDPDPSQPRWLWDVIVRGLSLEPDQRFASMDELLALLTRNRDRARRRTRLAGLTLGATAVIGISIAVLTARQAPPPPCPLATDELTGVWDPPTQQRVETALLGTGVAFAANVWASTQGSFDRYSQRWLKAHQAACEATNVRHVQSAELLDRRMECLAGRKRSLAAAVEVMQLRPSQAVARAGEILSSLGEIELCADTGVLLELSARSERSGKKDDPQRKEQMNSARKHLARAVALFATGDVVATESEIIEVERLEKLLDDEPLRAELSYYEGRVKLVRGEIAESIVLFERAANLAVSSRHDELSAEIWLMLAREVGIRELKLSQIETWIGQGEAWLQRLGHTKDSRRIWVDYARGNLQMAQGNAKNALSTFTRALDFGASLWGKDDPRLIGLLRERSTAHARLRQAKESIADAERALAIGIAAWGADYPDIARTRRALGLLYIEQLGDVERGRKEIEKAVQLFRAQSGDDSIEVANCEQALTLAAQYRGDYVSALDHAERAEKIYRVKLGEDHPRRGEALIGVGVARFMRKNFAGSLEAYQLASPIMRAALGEEHSSIAVLRSNIGEALLVLGRAEAAREEFEKALRILEKSLGAEHADLALPLKGLGLAYLNGNRPGDALAPLERALSLRTRSESASDPQEIAEIRWALARALRATARTPSRAKELATAALETYRSLGPESAERAAEISRWLKSSNAK
jgi:eukaryotic-like serine/threonine-protein kinase